MNDTVIWDFPDLRELGERGAEIYRKKYQADFEARYRGQVAAIDVHSERAFVAPTMTEAGRNGRAECPGAFFYFVRVGFAAVYRCRR
jgi:hypothetical protein